MEQADIFKDRDLLILLTKRSNHDQFARFIRSYALHSTTRTLVEDIGEYYSLHPEATELDWGSFLTWVRVIRHPGWRTEQIQDVSETIETVHKAVQSGYAPDPSLVDRLRELDTVHRINLLTQEANEKAGTDSIERIEELCRTHAKETPDSFRELLVVSNLEELLDDVFRSGGLEWRLEDLNRSAGPLHSGDLVVIGKRPEVGGTTFLTSEMTHMLPQLPEGKHGIIINNEERGAKLRLRVYQSALASTVVELATDLIATQAHYDAALAGHRLDILHNTAARTSDVDRILSSGEYGLIGINVLDKLRGFDKLDSAVERLRSLAQWARVVADRHGVVFAVMQADASAEGERYPDQSRLYGSKTGVQGEADLLLMIGRDLSPGMDESRFFNVAKNKLPGGPRSDPKMRHAKFECKFDGERGRFESISFPSRSK